MKRALNKIEDEVIGHIQPIPGRLVLVMATGEVNAQHLAQRELENRGVGTSGRWVGFPEAEAEWMAFRDVAAKIEPAAPILEDIARTHCLVETLQVRHSDDLDFHDIGVVGLRAALLAAYRAGRQSNGIPAPKFAKLTPEEDVAWTDAFAFAKGIGKSDRQADTWAWLEVCGKFPRLRDYDGAQT